jgi:hypothetical protein
MSWKRAEETGGGAAAPGVDSALCISLAKGRLPEAALSCFLCYGSQAASTT